MSENFIPEEGVTQAVPIRPPDVAIQPPKITQAEQIIQVPAPVFIDEKPKNALDENVNLLARFIDN